MDIAAKKNVEKVLGNDQSWLKTMDKGNTKLNRINICKLQ